MRFLRMKYEQMLMRLFDRFVRYLSNTRLDWYPKHALGFDDLDIKIHDLELENDKLQYYLLDAEDRIRNLSERLYYYEPYKED